MKLCHFTSLARDDDEWVTINVEELKNAIEEEEEGRTV